MKKLFKTMAAISAAATLAIPANITANAYPATPSNSSNPLVNYDESAGRGQRWEFATNQQGLPLLTDRLLNSRGEYTYYATIDRNKKEYGNCDMFALLPRNIAETSNINKARSYVDNLSVKSKSKNHYYALVLEYKDNTGIDSLTGTEYEEDIDYDLVDYGMRMLEGPYLNDILNKFTIDSTANLNYNYIKQHGRYEGYVYLKNYYVAGMRLSSSDPYTSFDEPVLEPNPDGIGFRTKVRFTVRNPEIEKTILLSSSTVSTAGYNNYDVLKDVKFTCNGSGTQSNYIDSYSSTNIGKKTLSIPKSEFYERNNKYQGLIRCYDYPDDFLREVAGSDKEYFDQNNFVAAKRSGNNIYIYIGKKYNTMITDPDWQHGTGSTKFNGFFRCGGRDILGHCRWLRTQLDSASYVYFYSDATPNSYTSSSFYNCSASTLLNRLNNG